VRGDGVDTGGQQNDEEQHNERDDARLHTPDEIVGSREAERSQVKTEVAGTRFDELKAKPVDERGHESGGGDDQGDDIQHLLDVASHHSVIRQ
jgi:hypothetical protein